MKRIFLTTIFFSFMVLALPALSFEAELAEIINKFRAENDQSWLTYDYDLAALADVYSAVMAEADHMTHDLWTDSKWRKEAAEFGIYYSATELIVMQFKPIPDAILCFRSLLRSDSHLAGMLTYRSNVIGIGYAVTPMKVFVTIYLGDKND
jgi:uncharacterized protein YkwD